MKQRWLFVDSATNFGGHEVMLLRWIEEAESIGLIEARVLARPNTTLSERAQKYLCKDVALPRKTPRLPNGEPLKARRLFEELVDVFRMATTIRRAARQEDPAVCIVATGNLGYLGTVVATKLSGRKTVVYVPLVDSFAAMGYRLAGIKDWVVRRVLSRIPDAWITITGEQARSFIAWAGIKTPVHALPNTVTREIENAQVRRTSTGPIATPLKVLVFGRLDSHQKGLDFLIEHLERTDVSPEALHFSIVGDGPYGDYLRGALNRNPKLQRLITLSAWGGAKETMAANDVLFLPSRFEGVPLVMLEAMAMGLPVIASDMPATRAYLPADCLFDIGDMSSAMEKLCSLRVENVRTDIAAHNRGTFQCTASGSAFSHAVQRLTTELLSSVQEVAATSATPIRLER